MESKSFFFSVAQLIPVVFFNCAVSKTLVTFYDAGWFCTDPHSDPHI